MMVILLTFLCALLLVPTAVFFLEVTAAVMPLGVPGIPSGSRPSRVAVLIPAHDEETTIADTLRSIAPQLNALDRLVVVADNCSDQTEEVARREGADVIVRHDRELRGKGYALDYGVRQLEIDAPDVLIIVDADCLLESGSLETLAAAAATSGRPIQAIYRMRAPEGAGLRTRIAEFAWLTKNQVRPLGLLRMGLPCQLMGTGMAFPWACIRTAPLATDHLVEDLKLGLDLARRGRPPILCTQAVVSSKFPTSDEGIRSQRTRWEHGHLRSILGDGPKLLVHSMIHWNPALAVMALDLSVPPLALLAMLITSSWAISLAFALTTGMQLPLYLATVSILLFGAAVGLSWGFFGRKTVSATDLALASVYAICKIPLYLKFILKPQSKWIRSKR